MEFDELGETEKFTAKKFIEVVSSCKATISRLIEAVDKIDISEENIANVITNPEYKKSVILCIEKLNILDANLASSELLFLITEVLVNKKEATNA